MSPELQQLTAKPEFHKLTCEHELLERRPCLELRADLNPQPRIIGHAVVFDVRSADLGGFVEVVKPQAVERALTGDVRCLYNHDPGAVLGRTPKTLTLTKDARGLAFSLTPADTTAGRDCFELVKRGDVTGASFGFRTLRDSWRQEAGITVRELLDVEILEISLTAFPSYQATDVAVAQRSLMAFTGRIKSTFAIAALRRELKLR